MDNYRVCMICVHLCLLWISLTGVYGQSCDLSLTASSVESTQNAVVGSTETCTWTINTLSDKHGQQNEFGNTTYTVRVSFRGVNLTDHRTCNVTNSLTVYDGADTSGPILGLVCGDELPSFQSSGRSLTLKYPTSQLTETSTFTMRYRQMYPGVDICRNLWVNAVASTECNILSPMYPNGMETIPYDCTWWVQSSGDKERVHISIDTGRTECSDVNVTISNDQEGNWCPGKENRFQSWDTGLMLKVRITPGEGIRVKYRALEASTCVFTLNATTEEQFLTTPNYPEAFPSFTECRWLIENWSRKENTIRLEVVDMDMEETDGCVTDSLSIRDGQFDFEPIIATICDTERSSFEVYKHSAQIVFKSVRESNTRKGIKIKYFINEADPCGGNLTANASIQSIQSPGYPFSFPRSIYCEWTITPVNPDNYVEVEVLEYQSSSISSSCYEDRLNIYDGSTDSAYLLARLCGTPVSREFQGTEEAMKIVFMTGSFRSKKGFRMTYKESEGPMIFHRRLKVNFLPDVLVSPRFPDGNVRDMDSTWTFSNKLGYTYKQIMLTFTNVDIGDADDCANNYIRVFNGNTSSPQSSTLCGKETGVYLSRGSASLLTVIMKTDHIPTPRGFEAKYAWLFDFGIPGCNGTAKTETAYSFSSASEITTPNYPNPYPNFAECSHILKPVLSSYFLRVNIVDAEFAGPVNCTKDYIEIFDGDTTAATSLGRICRNTSKTFESTRPGTNMLIRFISDSNMGAKGAKLSFVAFSKESSAGVPIWIPIFVSVLVGVFLIGVIVVCFLNYSRKTGSGSM